MSLFKRKDSPYWWIKLVVNGHRVQKSSGTTDKQKAQEYHDKLKAQMWDETRLGIKPAYTWNEAVIRWLRETEHHASREDNLIHLRWLDKYLSGMKLSDIRGDCLERILTARKAEGVSNSTVNRMLEIVRAILRKAAYEWEWLDKAPKVRMLPKPEKRVRYLSREEAQRLMDELPPHLEAMARFSLETGLRQRNVSYLEWTQVDIERRCAWIHPDQAKAKKAIAVPLSEEAIRIILEQKGKNPRYVFTYKGKPVRQVNTKAWRNALKRAGIEDFRWHDLRHTWASWHIQNGTPKHVLQELGGWSCGEMVERYAHFASEHLAPYADMMSKAVNLYKSHDRNCYDAATA